MPMPLKDLLTQIDSGQNFKKKAAALTAFRIGTAVAGVFALHVAKSSPARIVTVAALGSLV